MSETQVLVNELRKFAADRDWNQFHDPKNLAMALVVEAGELVEIFQWMTPEQSRAVMEDQTKAVAVREELADVFAYLLRLADLLGVSLNEALEEKLIINAEKYPIDLARGHAKKYTEFQGE